MKVSSNSHPKDGLAIVSSAIVSVALVRLWGVGVDHTITLTCFLNYSLTYSAIYPLTFLPTYRLTPSPSYPLTHHPLTTLPTYLLTHVSSYPLTFLPTYPLTHYPLTRPLTHHEAGVTLPGDDVVLVGEEAWGGHAAAPTTRIIEVA